MVLLRMDGFAVVGKLKHDEQMGCIPEIAVTAHAMKRDRGKAIAANCDDYIGPSPPTPGRLSAKSIKSSNRLELIGAMDSREDKSEYD